MLAPIVDDWRGRPPALTVAAAAVMSAFMVMQAFEPAVLAALRRDVAALEAGEWWRLVTPVLVQADGWAQFAFNLVGLATVGAGVERRCGRFGWIASALAGLAVGEWTGYRWDPAGAGTSIVVCGLIGGLAAFTWRHDRRESWPLEFSFYWMTALAGNALFGPAGAAAACVALSLAITGARARRLDPRRAAEIAVVAMLAGAVLLCVLADNHGPPTLAGALAALLVKPRG